MVVTEMVFYVLTALALGVGMWFAVGLVLA
jgi:hypothetical protein